MSSRRRTRPSVSLIVGLLLLVRGIQGSNIRQQRDRFDPATSSSTTGNGGKHRGRIRQRRQQLPVRPSSSWSSTASDQGHPHPHHHHDNPLERRVLKGKKGERPKNEKDKKGGEDKIATTKAGGAADDVGGFLSDFPNNDQAFQGGPPVLCYAEGWTTEQLSQREHAIRLANDGNAPASTRIGRGGQIRRNVFLNDKHRQRRLQDECFYGAFGRARTVPVSLSSRRTPGSLPNAPSPPTLPPSPPTTFAPTNPYSCDYAGDACAFVADGTCDAGTTNANGSEICPVGSDCLDCDPCAQYKFDCTKCVANGCLWCPGDALCSSKPMDSSYFLTHNTVSSCEAADYTSTCNAPATDFFSDPLYPASEWAFQLLNVVPVWKQGITGKGVLLRFNDDGIDIHHKEFEGRFDMASSCSTYLPQEQEDWHGTAVASIAAAAGNNGVCSVGIAPEATLSSCYNTVDGDEWITTGVGTVDISVNSWNHDACLRKQTSRNLQTDCPFTGPDNPCTKCPTLGPECEKIIVQYCTLMFNNDPTGCIAFLDLLVTCGYNSLSNTEVGYITKGITEGRNGKGIIYTFAAGNEINRGEDVNNEGWLNSRFTIAVAAVGKQGEKTSYSTPGEPVFVSGPGGDSTKSNNTSDYVTNNVVAAAGTTDGCRDATVGTSFSNPAVAGVIALVLEANPNLRWRDAQGILATTSTKTSPNDPSWVTNGAGLHHSNVFGFGIANAAAAVAAAKSWINFGDEMAIIKESMEINLPIKDDATSSTSATQTVDMTEGSGFVVESVEIYVDVTHPARGQLEMRLKSPSNTRSILAPGKRPELSQLQGAERWKFLTVKNWGESPIGTWTLTAVDTTPGNLASCYDIRARFPFTLDDGTPAMVDCPYLAKLGRCDPTIVDATTPTITAATACCHCGGGRRTCVDTPFTSTQIVAATTYEMTCHRVQTLLGCEMADQILDETDPTLTAATACCACGGGTDGATIVPELNSWRMIIYGHKT